MVNMQELTEMIIKGNRKEATRLTQLLLDEGVLPQKIVDGALVPGMAAIGDRFKRNEAFVPEMLISARAMKESMKLLEPLLVKAGIKPRYTAVLGTVQGDLHDIGKNLVGMMWKGANIAVIDLGTNVTADVFLAAAREHHANIIGLSALLTTTMPAMQETVAALKKSGLDGARIMVGGAPITKKFAEQIGADGYAADAASAVDVAMQLVA